MATIAKKYVDELGDLKKKVEDSHKFFKRNYERFQDFLYFTFVSTLSQNDMNKLALLQKPPLSFNICESFISRLCGEFARHEPGVIVRADDGVDITQMSPEFEQTIEVIEAHLREILLNTNNDQMGYQVYRDLLSGGFSVFEIYTDYSNRMSFSQNIYAERVSNPCLCGFDPTATKSHKGDGEYAFKIVPYTEEDFCKYFDEGIFRHLKFQRDSDIDGFSWSYRDAVRKIILVCEMYKKVSKEAKIVKIAESPILHDPRFKQIMAQYGVKPRTTMYKDDYEKMIDMMYEANIFTVPPAIVDERKTERYMIERYTFCENELLKHEKTNYEHLPLVFVDGNSVSLQYPDSHDYEQVTRPYIYNLKSTQKLKDFAGQTMGAEIENLQQTKIIAPIEGMPDDEELRDSYRSPQDATAILYNAFRRDNPDIQIPPPREMQRTQTPSIVTETFAMTDRLAQSILGSYDAEMGMQRNDVSGAAIEKGAMQSNTASMPYYMGYIRGLNRVAEIIVSLIPKYYVTPRTIPVMFPDGKRNYVTINAENAQSAVMMNYDPEDLMVKVEPGASFSIQKQIALKSMVSAMEVMPKFNQFMNDAGIEIMLDNFEFRGVDKLKVLYEKWSEQQAPVQQQQQQMSQSMMMLDMQNKQADIQAKQMKAATEKQKVDNEQQMNIAKFIQNNEKLEADYTIAASKNNIAKQEADIDAALAINKIKQSDVEVALRAEEIQAENARTAAQNVLKISEHLHNMSLDNRNFAKEALRDSKVSPKTQDY